MDAVTIYRTHELQTPGPMEQAAAWIEALDLKPRTREAYRKNIGYYLAWLSAHGLRGTSRADVLAYKEHLTATYEAATVSAYLTAVRTFYAWLSITYSVPDIARGIKGARQPRGFRKDPLTADQVKAVLSAVDRDAPDGLRDYAILSLMSHTGIRVVEVQRADICDIRQVMGRSVLFVQGKGRDEKDEFVILSPLVLRAIAAYIRSRGETLDADAPLFVSSSDRNRGGRLSTRSLSRIVKQKFQEAGMDSAKLTAHSLRHTAITLALVGGATVQQAQAMARHANINTTMIYAHNLDRAKNKCEATIAAAIL